MNASNLPSSILRKIFQTTILADLTDETTPTIVLHPPNSDPISLLEDEFRLPTHESIIRTSLALSHVCWQWRESAVGFPELWRRVCLSHRTCTYEDLIPMTEMMLSRTDKLGLSLDVDFTDRQPFLPKRIVKGDKQNIVRLLSSCVNRCHSLRVEGSHSAIKLALDVWMQHNTMVRICGLGNATPLTQLHIVQSEDRPMTLDYTFFLNKVAPHVVSFRSRRANISRYPFGEYSMLREIVLEDVHVSAAVYRQVLSVSKAVSVILRRIEIGVPLAFKKTLTIGVSPSITTSLKLGDVRCDSEAKARAYSEFLLSTIICSVEELEFSEMETFKAWLSFISVFSEIVPSHYEALNGVRKLTLRKVPVKGSKGGGDKLFALTQVLPNLETLVIQDMKLAGDVLVAMWRWGELNGKIIWPALNQVVMNGRLLERETIDPDEGEFLVDYGMLHV
jgi:hypothetical protein